MLKDFYSFARDKHIPTTTMDAYFKRASINPTILEERKLNVAQLDVFSRLQADRIVFLGDPIDNEVANIIQAQLLYLTSIDDKDEISMYINSPGGWINAGLGIYDTMQFINPSVNTICTGLAASMAAVLLCAGEHGGRSILPHSRVLIHQPSGGTWGQASDVVIFANEIENDKKVLTEIMAEHTGQKYKKVYTDIDRDKWMSAQEAVEYGICDKILTKTK